MEDMSNRERSELAAHCRRVAAVAKSEARARGAELIADFEQQLDTRYNFDQSEVWREAMTQCNRLHQEMQAKVSDECERLGIPKEFAPSIGTPGWYSRGENAVKERRTELRRLAVTRVDAQIKRAFERIEAQAVGIQQQLLIEGLSGEKARAFLTAMPSADVLLPRLSIEAIEQEKASLV